MSLPVRGAWIEMTLFTFVWQPLVSLPVRGAWIEIVSSQSTMHRIMVAPRAGSVD